MHAQGHGSLSFERYQEAPKHLIENMDVKSVVLASFLATTKQRLVRKPSNGLTSLPAQSTTMSFEGLLLEVQARLSGWEVIKPPLCKGISGVEHRFSFLASKEGQLCGFELCGDVGEAEVLKAFVKRRDTRATVFLVCLKGRPSEGGSRLAREYGMRILGPADIESFFEKAIVLVAST